MSRGFRVFIGLALLGVGLIYGFGLGRYEWPPMKQIMAARGVSMLPPVSARDRLSIESRRAFLRKLPNIHADIVVLGDSITQDGGDWGEAFPGFSVRNRGVGWDTTLDVLDRLPDALAGKPKLVFLMIGINDIRVAHRTAEETAESVKSILRGIKDSGATPISESTLLPADFIKEALTFQEVRKLNILIAEWCQNNGIEFLDMNNIFAPQGYLDEEITTDGIHLNFDGYSRWQSIIKTVIQAKRL
jgi:lysophospholipase L1-like esterase